MTDNKNQPRKDKCPAFQVNKRADDFSCKNDAGGHTVHVDPKTGTRWGDKPPHGIRKTRSK